MSIDRNAKDPLRLRRNQQRLRVGDNTDSITLSPTGGIHNGTNGLEINVLTTKGDVFTYSTHPDRLPVGSNGQVISADSTQATGLKWIAGSPLTTKGDLYTFSTVNAALAVGSNGQVLSADSTQTTGLKWVSSPTGTVTSVGLSLPGIFTVSGSPVTTSGTLMAVFASQTANTIFAGPASGSAVVPAFRSLVAADVGITTKGDILTFGTSLSRLAVGTQGQVLTVNTAASNSIDWETPSQSIEFINGSNITTSTAFASYSLYTHRISTAANQTTGISFAIAAVSSPGQTPQASIVVTGGDVPSGRGILDVYVHSTSGTASAMVSAITFNRLNDFGTDINGPLRANNAGNAISQANGGVSANIGSVLFSATSVSTAVVASTDTNFDRSFTLPAGFFTAGKAIRVRGIVSFNNDLISTFTSQLKFGSVSLDSRTLTPVVSGTGLRAYFDVILTCFTTGASGTIARMGLFTGEQQASTTAQNNTGPIGGGTVVIDTTTTQVVQFSGSFSATSATNTAKLVQIMVESLN